MDEQPHPTVKTIRCTGTPYEIGVAHGRGAAEEIHHNVAFYGRLFTETANVSWEQARKRAVTIYEPTLRRLWPAILDEMAGIAEGAGGGLTRDDVLALNVRTEIVFGKVEDGCSAVSQRGKDGEGMWLAQNWDWVPEAREGMVFLHVEPAGSDFVLRVLVEAGIVGKMGFNNKGFGLLMNAIRSTASDPRMMPVHVTTRKMLQEARSVEEARALLDRYGVSNSINYVLGDAEGVHVDIEASPLGHSVIEPTRDGYIVHTNHLCAPERPSTLIDTPTPDSMTRRARLQELTERDVVQEVPTSFGVLRARLSDEQGSPTSICRGTPKGAVGVGRMTTLFTIVMELRQCKGWAVIGRACDQSLPVVEWSL